MLTRKATTAGRAPTAAHLAGAAHRLATTLLAILTGLALTITAPASALADPGAECPVGQTDCSVWDDEPGTPGDPGGGGGDGGGDGGGGDGGGGGGPAKCQWNGRPVDCWDDVAGWFNNSDGCYYKLADPQPADTPPGKQWYARTCVNGNGDLGASNNVLLDAPPPGFGAPPDPEELAFRALALIDLLPPRISVAPRRSQGPGLVGLPVWLWASPGRNYFGELYASASERGVSVRITAKVNQAVWSLGDGETVTCTGPGTPYSTSGPFAGQPSPDCGYHTGYRRAGTYRINATTHWTVEWEGGGQSGTIPVIRTSGSVEIQINELQVVTE